MYITFDLNHVLCNAKFYCGSSLPEGVMILSLNLLIFDNDEAALLKTIPLYGIHIILVVIW